MISFSIRKSKKEEVFSFCNRIKQMDGINDGEAKHCNCFRAIEERKAKLTVVKYRKPKNY